MKEIKSGIEVPRCALGTSKPTNRQTSQRTSQNTSTLERTPKQDRFESSSKSNKTKSQKQNRLESSSKTKNAQTTKQSIFKKPTVVSGLTCFIAGAAAMGIAGNTFNRTKPEQFDYIQEQIENSTDPYLIEALTNKQEAQKEVAKGFVDGDFVYYIIGSGDKDSYTYISAESFKDLFDIEDGELKKYNRMARSYMDTPPDPDGHRGVFTYDYYNFSDGDIVKVPLSAIETDDIDLDGYYKGFDFELE